MSYSTNRQWSDRFIPAIKALVGPHLLCESPLVVDMQQAADLIVMRGRDMMIACRVRRAGFADRYPFEFTVRSRLDNGAKTEMAKLAEGWGDWMFYGHAANDNGDISRWWLIDLHLWRAALIRNSFRDKPRVFHKAQSNGDGSHFFAFDLRDFNPPILIAGSHEVPLKAAA